VKSVAMSRALRWCLLVLAAAIGTLAVATPMSAASAAPADAGPRSGSAPIELCFAQPEVSACVAGTLGGSTPVGGTDVTLSGPGFEETQTTGEDGRFSFRVEQPGSYTITVDTETLPDGIEVRGVSERTFEVQLGQNLPALFNVRDVNYDEGGEGLTDKLIGGVFNGLKLGLLLALASLGLSLIYGTTGLSNFAHAEQVTLGGILTYAFVYSGGLNLWLGIVLTVLICAGTGYAQDRVIWQPLRRRRLGLTQMMIVTIGIAMMAQYSFQYFIGGSTEPVVVRDFGTTVLGPITVSNQSWIAMGVAVVAIAAVGYTLLYTRIGRATRAVSDNPALAAASGIDVDRIIRLVWTVSTGLAGLAGVFYSLAVSNNTVKWDQGLQILLLLFAAVTLGGLGTAWGALVGSLVIGLVVELTNPVGLPGDLKYATALVILILVLLIRPQGILGRATRVG
jgi:neutral amino acid transport system permease protein